MFHELRLVNAELVKQRFIFCCNPVLVQGTGEGLLLLDPGLTCREGKRVQATWRTWCGHPTRWARGGGLG